jgi:hypothetical protein
MKTFTHAERFTIANTIRTQLGGGKFEAMTGCHSFSISERNGMPGLSLKIPRNASKANCMIVSYDYGADLYNVEFLNVSIKGIKVIKEVKGAYDDMLQDLFRNVTGMATSL